MNTINGCMPVNIVSGTDAVFSAAREITALGSRCLIVTGGCSAEKSGAADDVKKMLAENGIDFAVFDETEPNPRTDTCRRAGDKARDFGARFLLGIGGGSVMDAAKAAAFYAADASLLAEEIYTRRQTVKPLPVVLVGTTAGTGSEVTGVSVLTDGNTGRKKSISGRDCYAAVSVCDPRYTFSMPFAETVSTALDAFAHASESYLSLQSNALSELYAEKAMEMVWTGLRFLYDYQTLPDAKLRETLYYGSIFAGLAINITGTLFPHTVGYVLTEEKGIPHGKACAAFAPVLFERYRQYNPEKLTRMETLLETPYQKITEILCSLCALPVLFSQEQAHQIARRWEGAPIRNFMRTPGGFDAGDAERALAQIASR